MDGSKKTLSPFLKGARGFLSPETLILWPRMSCQSKERYRVWLPCLSAGVGSGEDGGLLEASPGGGDQCIQGPEEN